ncbi:MAG: heparinase II/III family protein [Kiritimatiellae bacterium]|nr:heparinase II/III family protein [Kiritimatiellia bacterium]
MLPDAAAWSEKKRQEQKQELGRELPRLRAMDDGRQAGWYHDYFCNHDGARLAFDLDKPASHVCPTCGASYDEERHHRAWVTQFRWRRWQHLTTACAIATVDPSALAIVVPEFEWLAANYRALPVVSSRDSSGRTARLMGTALDESVTLCQLSLCLAAVRRGIPEPLMARLVSGYLVPAYDLQYSHIGAVETAPLVRKGRTDAKRPAHNILVWHGCALGCAALVMGDEDRLAYALDAAYGLKYQLANGPQEDGLWFEASVGYHFYALHALTQLLATAKTVDRQLREIEPAYRRMARGPARLYFSNGIAPAYSDSWAPARIESTRELYAAIERVCPDEGARALLAAAEGESLTVPEGACDLPGFRIVRARHGRWELAVKYGHLTRSHAHPDVGSVIVVADGEEAVSDLGSTGYGCDVHRWRRSPMSHNTVLVDDAFDGSAYLALGLSPGSCALDGNTVRVEGTIAGDCTLTRTLSLHEDRIEDTVRVRSDRERRWTWWLHLNAPFTHAPGNAAPGRFEGVPFITDVVDVSHGDEFAGTPLTVRLLSREDGDRVFAVCSPGNSAVPRRYGLAWDKSGREAEFRSVWTLRSQTPDTGYGTPDDRK